MKTRKTWRVFGYQTTYTDWKCLRKKTEESRRGLTTGRVHYLELAWRLCTISRNFGRYCGCPRRDINPVPSVHAVEALTAWLQLSDLLIKQISHCIGNDNAAWESDHALALTNAVCDETSHIMISVYSLWRFTNMGHEAIEQLYK